MSPEEIHDPNLERLEVTARAFIIRLANDLFSVSPSEHVYSEDLCPDNTTAFVEILVVNHEHVLEHSFVPITIDPEYYNLSGALKICLSQQGFELDIIRQVHQMLNNKVKAEVARRSLNLSEVGKQILQ